MPDNTPGDGTSTAAVGQQGGTPSGQLGQQQVPAKAPATWDEALATLPEPVRALYDAHTTGLRNTVQATRQERDALSGQLTALTKALGKDTPEQAKALLAEMAGQIEATGRRAAFYEEAGKPEIGCANPKAAFLVAQADGLFDTRGNVNWAALKTAAPELFRRPTPAGNAGQGTGTPPPATKSMNAFIRAAAGR
jgi:hypothetical protein